MPGSTGGPDCEGLIHFVTAEPVASQPVFPAGIQEIELSWSRTKAIMRLRVPPAEQEWLVKEMHGKVEFVEANRKTGRFLLRGKCVVHENGGHPKAHFWKPPQVRSRDLLPATAAADQIRIPASEIDALLGYPPGVKIELDPYGGVSYEGNKLLPVSHWRTCFRRAKADWRTRNERTGELFHVAGYTPGGVLNLNWQDGGSHIFHDGPIYLGDDLHVLFIDPDEV